MDISTMPKAVELITDLLDIMPDDEFKTWFRMFAATTLAKQQLPDGETLNVIKALRELDDVPADELRGFVKKLFADVTKEIEAESSTP